MFAFIAQAWMNLNSITSDESSCCELQRMNFIAYELRTKAHNMNI